ncbi:interferon alpha/beta receptor 2-like isoform X1 [Periophthalmus magnuspinnatus]|uniref:interferon alpha/beta receptor 2-like isoform X1 n=1 Tax=Periophthalmus magnuspinnatus TaxID=409849 RepID=UPI00145B2C61|nr:interferon alpha/beta receptor 2-like isoform X1 [Periophthalmus magnuspinnatus]
MLWTFLLLLMDYVLCVPHPVNVSIWSFNLEHILHFLPGPGTPANALFGIQVLKLSKGKWRDVARCTRMNPAQPCDLTLVFKDPMDIYQARVQAFTSDQRSNWTESALFQPLSDTILGPPLLMLSGCGNCLLLRISPPLLKTDQPLNLLAELHVQVQRSRDGAQFNLSMPLREEIRVEHLQRGVEYCVIVTVHTMFNENSTPSKRLCAESSPPVTAPVGLVSIVAVVLSALLVSLLVSLLGWLLFCFSPVSREL